MRSSFLALGIGVALLALEGAASAAPTSTLATETELKDALSDIDGRDARPFSVSLNPFMAVIGSGASGNLEYVPVRHFGLIASPRASVTMPAWVGEVGMRYWSGKKREASGFFLGPSAVYGRTHGAPLYGVALDCGVQTIFDSGITIGAGIGVQYLQGTLAQSSLELGPLQSDDAKLEHAILPRLLFSVGYSL